MPNTMTTPIPTYLHLPNISTGVTCTSSPTGPTFPSSRSPVRSTLKIRPDSNHISLFSYPELLNIPSLPLGSCNCLPLLLLPFSLEELDHHKLPLFDSSQGLPTDLKIKSKFCTINYKIPCLSDFFLVP